MSSQVVIMDCDGQVIARTNKCGFVRLLLKDGDAEPVKSKKWEQFTVKLKTHQKYDW